MLQVEYIPVGELKTYANNAKLHPAEQVEQIKKSIEEFGFNDPIAVWKDNEIIEGHGRLIAAEELGLEEVPIIRLDELSDEQRRAYALVHNKLTMNSDFDLDMLSLELDGIGDIDMGEFGFDIGGPDEEPQGETKTAHFNYQEQYGVIVICGGEAEQERVYNDLADQGYICKVVCT